ncbi:hypothetical protein RDI58_027299 [Solanum bulbocastanum]|uniref:Uncharacterized protein n=1 Tax=Solanum bulbocastanum TaxID=147425 RepID=A0AAN8SV41_SOLBU
MPILKIKTGVSAFQVRSKGEGFGEMIFGARVVGLQVRAPVAGVDPAWSSLIRRWGVSAFQVHSKGEGSGEVTFRARVVGLQVRAPMASVDLAWSSLIRRWG